MLPVSAPAPERTWLTNMPNNRKKVIVRMTAGSTIAGYLSLSGIARAGNVELLDLSGRVLPIPLGDIKTICYVGDFNLNDSVNPERLTRKTFLARPRSEGLWLRIAFPDGDLLEALAPLDRTLLDAIASDGGLFLIPPDIRGNTQRLFVPHAAIQSLQLLAVITTPSKPKPASPQKTLFD